MNFTNYLLILFTLSANLLQAQQITNVQTAQDGDNVNITFDITGAKTGQTFDVELRCSVNNGATFTITPTSISGDVKGISGGNDKKIIWYVLQDRDEMVGEDIVFEVNAMVIGGESDFTGKSGTFTDSRDNHTYKWVSIGKQVWMAENLAYKANSGCWAYDNNESNVAKYGYLYDWETANKVCPNGWQLPSDDDWNILEQAVGLSASDLQKASWRGTHANALKENGSSGFSVLCSGTRNLDGTFSYADTSAYFWSSSAYDALYAWRWYFLNSSASVSRNKIEKQRGFSVRCTKN